MRPGMRRCGDGEPDAHCAAGARGGAEREVANGRGRHAAARSGAVVLVGAREPRSRNRRTQSAPEPGI